MQTLAIVADDLTGAADCAARCRHAGLPATIYLRAPALPLPPGAVALTSDSRHLSADTAAERVRALLDLLKAAPATTWYKKIDSTLRGHLGAELDAALDVLGRICALICPAFPAQQRGLYHGQLVGAAVASPDLHLPALLAQQSRRPVQAIPLEVVRAGPAALVDGMAAMRNAGAQLIVVDALTDEDLDTIVAAAQALPDALLCGSAGLVGALAARLAQGRIELSEEVVAAPLPMGAGETLLVVGSGSRRAHEQIAYLRAQQAQVHEVGAGAIPDAAGALLLHLPEPGDAALEGPAAREAAALLAGAALAAIERRRPATLVLCGGDTAIAVLARLGIARLTVLREVLPGMPLAWGVDDRGGGYFVILKAGNHGDSSALAALLQMD